MIRFKHWLFGWDYVHVEYYSVVFISRVRTLPDRRLYYKRGDHLVIIEKPTDVVWLTCRPDKYFRNLNKDKNE